MNGHRLISGSTQQTNPDYPFLPELAIERVEIGDGLIAVMVAGRVFLDARRLVHLHRRIGDRGQARQ